MPSSLLQRRTKLSRRIRRERRRFGRFVAFSEMLSDLTPVQLFDKPPASELSASENRSDRKPNN